MGQLIASGDTAVATRNLAEAADPGGNGRPARGANPGCIYSYPCVVTMIIKLPPMRTQLRRLWKLDRGLAVMAAWLYATVLVVPAALAVGAWVVADAWHAPVVLRAVVAVGGTALAGEAIRRGLPVLSRAMNAFFIVAHRIDEANRLTGAQSEPRQAA